MKHSWVDYMNPRESQKTIRLTEILPPITCRACRDNEPRPRTRNQKDCNRCIDEKRWGKR